MNIDKKAALVVYFLVFIKQKMQLNQLSEWFGGPEKGLWVSESVLQQSVPGWVVQKKLCYIKSVINFNQICTATWNFIADNFKMFSAIFSRIWQKICKCQMYLKKGVWKFNISINFMFTSTALQRSLNCLMCASTALHKCLKQLFLIVEMHKHISIQCVILNRLVIPPGIADLLSF